LLRKGTSSLVNNFSLHVFDQQQHHLSTQLDTNITTITIMQPTTSTMATLLTLLLTTTYTTASSFQVNNYCNASLWATISSPAAPYPAAWEIPSGVANAYDIVGKGSK
jgi:hypothetical protein